jgi:HEAT repeat protein
MKQTVETRVASLERAVSSGKMPVSVDLLAKAMRDPSPSVRSKAVQIVAEHEVEAAVPIVKELLYDQSEQVRIEVVKCLGSFREISTQPREKIRSLLRDKSFLVRIQTLESLSLLRDQGALPSIAQLLADENPLVRAYSARSIAALGAVSYVQAIQDALRAEKQDPARVGFLEALFLLGKKEIFDTFLQLLLSPDYRVRCTVANALEEMPLDQFQIESAIAALTQAAPYALGVADKSSIARVLVKLREKLASR